MSWRHCAKDASPLCCVSAATELNSTPNAAGSAAISEHSTLGVEYIYLPFGFGHRTPVLNFVNARSVDDELLDGSKDTSVPSIEKPKPFADSFKAVVHICNDENIKGHVSDFTNCTVEIDPKIHFNDEYGILFHYNDYHGNESKCTRVKSPRADVVVISYQTAKGVRKDDDDAGRKSKGGKGGGGKGKGSNGNGKGGNSEGVTDEDEEVLDVTEEFCINMAFKRNRGCLNPPPEEYSMTEYAPPKPPYMKQPNNPTEPPSSAPGSAAASAQSSNQPGNELRRTRVRATQKQMRQERASDRLCSNKPPASTPRAATRTALKRRSRKRCILTSRTGCMSWTSLQPTSLQHVITYVDNDDVIYI
ncbi:hypothetical protein DFH29DRAFT_1023012 [Suillus ampliporus]|nr:hypothetical protein DFH29DRAFT_1023012 [Suillus ampliporus]